MKNTYIQWCHSTVNPVMGCDGCELWPRSLKISGAIRDALCGIANLRTKDSILALVHRVMGDRTTSEIYRDRHILAKGVRRSLDLDKKAQQAIVGVISSSAKCYAGLLGNMRAGHKGYAVQFEQPKLFPGRMAAAARWAEPSDAEVIAKPWLEGLPRTIFISDMGDALSSEISFEYLDAEIIKNVVSEHGRRHIWLWLTKRPGRMSQFGKWLGSQGILWPENLVAMTTVTSQQTTGRVAELLKVPSRFKGLSVEPLFGKVKLPLVGIDWVIVGGGSDTLAEPFHCERALDIREQCAQAGAAFFLKQLGKHPFYGNKPLVLSNRHGGEWGEWPAELRMRELPPAWKHYRPRIVTA